MRVAALAALGALAVASVDGQGVPDTDHTASFTGLQSYRPNGQGNCNLGMVSFDWPWDPNNDPEKIMPFGPIGRMTENEMGKFKPDNYDELMYEADQKRETESGWMSTSCCEMVQVDFAKREKSLGDAWGPTQFARGYGDEFGDSCNECHTFYKSVLAVNEQDLAAFTEACAKPEIVVKPAAEEPVAEDSGPKVNPNYPTAMGCACDQGEMYTDYEQGYAYDTLLNEGAWGCFSHNSGSSLTPEQEAIGWCYTKDDCGLVHTNVEGTVEAGTSVDMCGATPGEAAPVEEEPAPVEEQPAPVEEPVEEPKKTKAKKGKKGKKSKGKKMSKKQCKKAAKKCKKEKGKKAKKCAKALKKSGC